jgi:nucleotide-binding universal stress UspA family protein
MADAAQRALAAIDALDTNHPRVVVECRNTPAGHDALRAAAALADERDALLTVVATAPTRGECRKCCGPYGEGQWSDLVTSEARAELLEAASALGSGVQADYTLARGRRTQALLAWAEETHADVLIVVGRPPRGLSSRAGCAVLGT